MSEIVQPPFIYIGALVRTGSTLLSEALTQFPYSYIFHEPHLGRNVLEWNPVDKEQWEARGVPLGKSDFGLKLSALLLRTTGARPDFTVSQVKARYLAGFRKEVQQIGVKETINDGWLQYAKHFPNMKIILPGRDPRDIYLSFREAVLRHGEKTRNISPEQFAERMMEQFAFQQQMAVAADCFPVRYEDLVTDPRTFAGIKEFVNSPIPDIGEIGGFTSRFPGKEAEHRKHAGEMTDAAVARWRKEQDRSALDAAFEVFDRMQAYADFWGYSRGN